MRHYLNMQDEAKMNVLIKYTNIKHLLCTKDCRMEIHTKKHTQRPRTNQTFTVDKGVAISQKQNPLCK